MGFLYDYITGKSIIGCPQFTKVTEHGGENAMYFENDMQTDRQCLLTDIEYILNDEEKQTLDNWIDLPKVERDKQWFGAVMATTRLKLNRFFIRYLSTQPLTEADSDEFTKQQLRAIYRFD